MEHYTDPYYTATLAGRQSVAIIRSVSNEFWHAMIDDLFKPENQVQVEDCKDAYCTFCAGGEL